MFKKLVLLMALPLATATASEFVGEYKGFDGSRVTLNERAYPISADVSVVYRSQQQTIDLVPPGVSVRYVLKTVGGASTVVGLTITETSPELDQLFPPR